MSDNILFRQPESSHLGDCPICILPLPLDTKKSMMQSCCTKRICIGCYCAGIKFEMGEKLGKRKRICPFCRQPEPKEDVEIEGYKTRRMEVNDPVAIREAGKRCYHQGDYESAFEYFSKAADQVMRKHIIACHLCTETGTVLAGKWQRDYTIWKRLLLAVIPKLDTILGCTK
ncbi:hypothetical protein QTG54_008157 [Skeletonema marinoi]|uniref:RING-type domain-containing protein n=1 Tax=Skeletonema marinoi TaxID=267567 RepID=A0AAD8Y8D9_9STRA|nr:hypothetical protein QTG54_008157 [Skeletonema marinoi]